MAHGGMRTTEFAPTMTGAGTPAMPAGDFGGPAGTPGFAHMLGDPGPGARSTLANDPVAAQRVLGALFDLLPPAGAIPDNPEIAAGYTFLLQFVAHDMVESSLPMWLAGENGLPSRNRRSMPLRLDTLYGGGPASCPAAYQAEPHGADRVLLRLGRTTDTPTVAQQPDTCPFRDVARITGNAAKADVGNFSTPSQPHLADQRNDEGLVLSQLVVLMSLLHNALVARLPPGLAPLRFAQARAAMLRMYHAVIRRDLMPMLLNTTVINDIAARAANSSAWLWTEPGMPLEFSHGAFRFGHAMVRPAYRFNALRTLHIGEVLSGPGWRNGNRETLPQDWVAQWSGFFPMAPQPPPAYSLQLAARKRSHLDVAQLLPGGADDTRAMSLRDWLSAAHARMWRTDALLAQFQPLRPGLPWLPIAEVRSWLAGIVAAAHGNAAARRDIGNLDSLAGDLPLPLYVLLEAERCGGGMRLGPLGSIIVGEVMFRRLTEAEAELAPFLPRVSQAFGADWARIDGVATMPDLVQLTADWGGLAACTPIPFI